MTEEELDNHIGAMIRTARQDHKLTQAALGQHLGIAYQMIQKYEKGRSPVTAARLYSIAAALNRPVAYFLPAENGARIREMESRIAAMRAVLKSIEDAARKGGGL